MKVTLEEYIDVARKIKLTHKQLPQIMEMIQDKLSRELIQPLLKMEDYLKSAIKIKYPISYYQHQIFKCRKIDV